MLRDGLLAGFLVVAAIYDVNTGRIPNTLIGTMAICGMLYNCFFCVAIHHPMLGILLPLLCTGLLFIMRVFGAGDVKLLCAAGIFLGEYIIKIICISFVCSAVWGLLLLLVRREFFTRIYRGIRYFLCLIIWRQLYPYPYGIKSRNRLTVPYAVFVLIAYLLDCWS